VTDLCGRPANEAVRSPSSAVRGDWRQRADLITRGAAGKLRQPGRPASCASTLARASAYAGADIARRLTRAFLRWAMHNKLLARVTIQRKDIRNPTPLSQRHRFVLIRQLLTDEDIPM
jgi:hypothetical protein